MIARRAVIRGWLQTNQWTRRFSALADDFESDDVGKTCVKVERDGELAIVTLNRGKKI